MVVVGWCLMNIEKEIDEKTRMLEKNIIHIHKRIIELEDTMDEMVFQLGNLDYNAFETLHSQLGIDYKTIRSDR